MLSRPRLTSLLANFPRLRIALVGDLYLDRYLEIEPHVREMSIETGLEAYQVTRVRNSPGALGTVMNNLAALGVGSLVPVTVIGDDGHAYDLLRELVSLPVETKYITRDPARLTPTYTKPMKPKWGGTGGLPTSAEPRTNSTNENVNQTQKPLVGKPPVPPSYEELNRLDIRTRAALSAASQEQVQENVTAALAECDGLIVCDQVVEDDWGVVNANVRNHLAALAAKHPEKLIFVDSRAHMAAFDFGTLKPNRAECLASINEDPETATDEELFTAAVNMTRRTNRPVYCTLAERGILVAAPNEKPFRVPTPPVTGPIDIVGAGDSATAGIVAALLSGATNLEAAALGNLVASITIKQLGTTGVAKPNEVLDRLDSAGYETGSK